MTTWNAHVEVRQCCASGMWTCCFLPVVLNECRQKCSSDTQYIDFLCQESYSRMQNVETFVPITTPNGASIVAPMLLSVKGYQTCILYTQRRGGEMGRISFPRPHAALYNPKENWNCGCAGPTIFPLGKIQAAISGNNKIYPVTLYQHYSSLQLLRFFFSPSHSGKTVASSVRTRLIAKEQPICGEVLRRS